MNDVARRQNEPRMLDLLKARQRIYTLATRVQAAQLTVAVALPLVLAGVGLIEESARPWVAVASLLAVVCDALVLDRRQRLLLERAAKVSEQFDCELLCMEWDSFAAGRKVDAETVAGSARAWRGVEAALSDWYPPTVVAAPLHLARLVCQRANLWYDSSLRKRVGDWLLFTSLGVTAALLAAGLALNLDVAGFATTLMAPATPFLAWSIRERFRQIDAATAIEGIKTEAEDVWRLAVKGEISPEQCAVRSRRFQNAIYARRVANPLPLPFIYRLLRGEKELEMNAGADELLREAGLTANPTGVPLSPSATEPKTARP